MQIDVNDKKGVCVFACEGDLTLNGGDLVLRRELASRLDTGERRFVFDLRPLRYMDSAGVGELVACSKRALERAAVVKIVLSEEGPVRRVFEITCLDRAFEIFDDPAKAVASY